MESLKDSAESCATASDARKNESYCPHYERDTCLIHFKCCDEEDWYPCHKCHNEAVILIEDQHEIEQDNNKPLMDNSDDNSTASSISEEGEYLEVGGSSQAENRREPEDQPNNRETNEENDITPDPFPRRMETKHSMAVGMSSETKGLQDDAATSGEVEEANNVADEATDGPRINEDAYHNGDVHFERTEENALQLAVDSRPPSPAEQKKTHSLATALDGTRLKCTTCKGEQGFAQNCESCHKSFASYFCEKCKLLIEKKVDPYHCDDCGICRGNKADHFHCHVCNVCMAHSLKENHKCFADRGHDPCAICWEEVFSGAVFFPCFHMVHKDCAEKLLLSGSRVCPMCRNVIFQDDEDAMTSEETSHQTPSSEESVSRFCQIGRKISSTTTSFFKFCQRVFTRNTSAEGEIEMDNVSTP